jgi:hypothetical protein
MKNGFGYAALLVPICFLLASSSLAYSQEDTSGGRKMQTETYIPEGGFIPDHKTAEDVASIILSNIYGAKQIKDEEPFISTLENDVWVVKGTLHNATFGGVAEIHIRKKDGRIIFVSHGQ